jgi:hypothetical protein
MLKFVTFPNRRFQAKTRLAVELSFFGHARMHKPTGIDASLMTSCSEPALHKQVDQIWIPNTGKEGGHDMFHDMSVYRY